MDLPVFKDLLEKLVCQEILEMKDPWVYQELRDQWATKENRVRLVPQD